MSELKIGAEPYAELGKSRTVLDTSSCPLGSQSNATAKVIKLYMYEKYKRLRNVLTKIDVRSALLAIWSYSEYISNGRLLSTQLSGGHNVKAHLHLHQLSLLAREVIINCVEVGGKEFTYSTLASSMNAIRDIEGYISLRRLTDTGVDQVLDDLHPLVHNQFLFNRKIERASYFLRYAEIYRQQGIQVMMEKELGSPIVECYFLAMHIVGGLRTNPGVLARQDLSNFGIDSDQSERFFSKVALPLDELKSKLISVQSYDDNWSYTWNPLTATPFVKLDKTHPQIIYCPLPSLVWHRLGHGLFYDFADIPAFGNLYGASFEKYVGGYLTSVLPKEKYEIFGEHQYHIGTNLKHGTDWIVSDGVSNIFIECKTKRITQAATMLSSEKALSDQLEKLAEAGVQLYKNMIEAQRGLPHWAENSRPSFPIIVTLEDWILFSPTIRKRFHSHLEALLIKSNIDPQIMTDSPMTITSCQEFEELIALIGTVGIQEIFEKKSSRCYEDWMVETFVREAFPESTLVHAETVTRKWNDFHKLLRVNWKARMLSADPT